jgi:hypothetical protein
LATFPEVTLAKKTSLSLVSDLVRKVPEPPAELGEHGRALWHSVMGQYDITDAGGWETLRQACCACDRAEACRQIIDEQGEVLAARGTIRSHPLLRDELQNRAFVVKAIQRLGLDLEPVKAIGRPTGP